jgi:hypothetical protein
VNHIETMLESLAQLRAQIAVRNLDKTTAIAVIMEPVRAQVMATEARFEAEVADLEQAAAEQEAAIKAAVTAHGTSVKGTHLHAVYAKGRASWDNTGLTGYAVAHPEINVFKTVGAPSVSIRATSGS